MNFCLWNLVSSTKKEYYGGGVTKSELCQIFLQTLKMDIK